MRRVALICAGLALGLLSLPPGPLPMLVLVADVPFLALLFFDGGRHWKRWTLLYGVLHIGLSVRWLAHITPIQVLASGLVMGSTYLLFGWAVRALATRRVPFALGFGLLAVFEEMLRMVWMGGFPWPARSLAFASTAAWDGGLSALLPAASWFGAWGFSFLAGLAGATVYREVVEGMGGRSCPRAQRLARLALVPAVLLGLMALVEIRRADDNAALSDGTSWSTEREMLVIQAVIPQSLKQGSPESTKRMFDDHVRLASRGALRIGSDNLLAILWPETMSPWPLLDADIAARFPEAWEDEVGVLRRLRRDAPLARNVPWLIGAIHHFRRGDERHTAVWAYGDYDSLFWLDPAQAPAMDDPTPAQPTLGTRAPWVKGRHDKVNLVPGGEYTPGGELFPPLKLFRKIISDFPGLDAGALEQEPWVFTDGPGGRALKVGSVVCYDIAFPRACRAWRRQGAQVLLNPGNYGWFGPTGFRAQIAAISRLRAAELAVTVVVAGNTGPTAFYDPLGRPYGRFQPADAAEAVPAGPISTTYVPGWAHAPLEIRDYETRYTAWGDRPWYLLGLVLVLASILGGRRPVAPCRDPA